VPCRFAAHPHAQFITEEGDKLTEKFACADKHLRPALPACLYPPTLDQYTVRVVISYCG